MDPSQRDLEKGRTPSGPRTSTSATPKSQGGISERSTFLLTDARSERRNKIEEPLAANQSSGTLLPIASEAGRPESTFLQERSGRLAWLVVEHLAKEARVMVPAEVSAGDFFEIMLAPGTSRLLLGSESTCGVCLTDPHRVTSPKHLTIEYNHKIQAFFAMNTSQQGTWVIRPNQPPRLMLKDQQLLSDSCRLQIGSPPTAVFVFRRFRGEQ